MSKVIPNERTWVGFSINRPTNLAAPSAATDIAAATNLTPLLVTINASSQGNTVPTPTLDSLFETSVPGTSAASFTADFYRDDVDDFVWELLLRGVRGYFYISRFGGTGPNKAPAATQSVEVWPVYIVSRTPGAETSNTVQMFTVTASVPEQPVEDAVVAA